MGNDFSYKPDVHFHGFDSKIKRECKEKIKIYYYYVR